VSLFIGVPGFYYLYMRHYSEKPWNVKNEGDYFPPVTILVPVYNEEKIIQFKLENLARIDYPKDRLQIILVDDCSNDRSMRRIQEFKQSRPHVALETLNNSSRMGKTAGLNEALSLAKGEIVVISDADCFWPPDSLQKALGFLSDPSVGAVAGLEALLNPRDSWVTESEILYNDAVHTIRTGESKIHSTILFQGGLGAYKRSLLKSFDLEADDSGTALNVVQKGVRTLLVSEAVYFTTSPNQWKEKIAIKSRRASQLVRLWFRCLKLSVKGELRIPWKIFVPEAFLYLVNPLIFPLIVVFSVIIVFENPVWLLGFATLLVVGFSFRKSRTLILEVVQDHLVLLGAIFSSVLKKRISLWTTVRTSRASLSRRMLEEHGLV